MLKLLQIKKKDVDIRVIRAHLYNNKMKEDKNPHQKQEEWCHYDKDNKKYSFATIYQFLNDPHAIKDFKKQLTQTFSISHYINSDIIKIRLLCEKTIISYQVVNSKQNVKTELRYIWTDEQEFKEVENSYNQLKQQQSKHSPIHSKRKPNTSMDNFVLQRQEDQQIGGGQDYEYKNLQPKDKDSHNQKQKQAGISSAELKPTKQKKQQINGGQAKIYSEEDYKNDALIKKQKQLQVKGKSQEFQYFRDYLRCCLNLEKLLKVLQDKQNKYKKQQKGEEEPSNHAKKKKKTIAQMIAQMFSKNKFTVSVYQLETKSQRKQYYCELRNDLQNTNTQKHEVSCLFIDITSAYQKLLKKSNQERQFDDLFLLNCIINYTVQDIDPKIQFMYNVSFVDKEQVKVVTLDYQIQDHHSFLEHLAGKRRGDKHVKKQNKEEYPSSKLADAKPVENKSLFKISKRDRYNDLDYCYLRKGSMVPFRQGKYDREVQFSEKHLSLAFQGGGAKGAAYIGAYEALKELLDQYNDKKKKQDQKKCKIKSIIGSSAGGIIALAVSTGINHRKVQKIVEATKDIAKNDRAVKPSAQQKQGQTEKKLKAFKTALGRLLDQYGLIDEAVYQSLMKAITQQFYNLNKQLKNVKKDLWLEFLKLIPDLHFLFTQDQSLDLYGLLMNGSLLKGDEIRKIAAECIVQFFIHDYQSATQEKDIEKEKAQLQYKYSSVLDKGYKSDPDSKRKIILQNIKQIKSIQFKAVTLGELSKIKITSNEQKIKEGKEEKTKQEKNLLKIIFISAVNKILLAYFNKKYLKKLQSEDKQWSMELDLSGLKCKNLFNVIQLQKKNADIMSKLLIECGEHQAVDNSRTEHDQVNRRFLTSNFWMFLKCMNVFNCLDRNRSRLPVQPQADDTQLDQIIRYVMKKTFDVQKSVFHEHLFYLLDAEQFEISHLFDRNKGLDEHIKELFTLESKENRRYLIKEEEIQQIVNDVVLQEIKKYRGWKGMEGGVVINYDKYTQSMDKLIEQAHKITLKEYYQLTRIEFTCTTVDVDSQILRFLNHKTTPELTVAKAVQITGSFPVAFKSQKWKKKWGKYHIFFSRQRLSIDVSGHNFTDGGMLANFPLKYTDNDDLNNKYFKHGAKSNVNILGFGLDADLEGKYTHSNVQKIFSEIYKPKQGFLMFVQILLYRVQPFKMLKPVLVNLLQDTALNFLQPEKAVYWSTLLHDLIDQIPVLNFGLKLVEAYPLADRNINLQAFNQRIIIEDLDPKSWTNNNSVYDTQNKKDYEKHLLEHQIRNLIYKYTKPIMSGPIRVSTQMIQQNKSVFSLKSDLPKERETSIISNLFKAKKNEIIIRQHIYKKMFQKGHLGSIRSGIKQSKPSEEDQDGLKSEGKLKMLSIMMNFDTIRQLLTNIFKKYYKDNQHFEIIQKKLLDQGINAPQTNTYKELIIYINFYSKVGEKASKEQIQNNISKYKNTDYHQLIKEARNNVIKFLSDIESQVIQAIKDEKDQSQISYLTFLFPQKHLKKQWLGLLEHFLSVEMISAQFKALNSSQSTLIDDEIIRHLKNFYLAVKDKNTDLPKTSQEFNKELKRFTKFKVQDLQNSLEIYNYIENQEQNEELRLDFWSIIRISEEDLVKMKNTKTLMKMLSRALYLLQSNEDGSDPNGISFEDKRKLKKNIICLFCGQDRQKFSLLHPDRLKQSGQLNDNSNFQIKEDLFADKFGIYAAFKIKLLYKVLQKKLQKNMPFTDGNNLAIVHKNYKTSFDKLLTTLSEVNLLINYYLEKKYDLQGKSIFEKVLKTAIECRQKLIKTLSLNYYKTIKKEVNTINQEALEKLYLLSFQDTEKIFLNIYLEMEKYNAQCLFNIYKKDKKKNRDSDVAQQNRDIQLSKFIVNLFERLFFSDIILPYFIKDFRIFLKSHNFHYIKKIEGKKDKTEVEFKMVPYKQLLIEKIEFAYQHQNNNKYKKEHFLRAEQGSNAKIDAQIKRKGLKNFELLNTRNKLEQNGKREIKIYYTQTSLTAIKHHQDQYVNLPSVQEQDQEPESSNQFQNCQQKAKKDEKKYKDLLQMYKQISKLEEMTSQLKMTSYENDNKDTHVILQGTRNVYQYCSTYLNIIFKVVEKSPSNIQLGLSRIRVVTCTNFHCIFGLLLAARYSVEKIRAQMITLKYISEEFQPSIESQFESFKWFGQKSTNHYKQLLQYLWTECKEIYIGNVNQIRMTPRQRIKNCLKPQKQHKIDDIIKDIKRNSRVEPEQLLQYFDPSKRHKVINIMRFLTKGNRKVTDELLDLTQKNLEFSLQQHLEKLAAEQRNSVQRHFDKFNNLIETIAQSSKVNTKKNDIAARIQELFKQFAFSSTAECSKYQESNQTSFNSFKMIKEQVFATFGSLLVCLICQFVQGYSHIHLTKQNSEMIVKGIIIKKLLSIYKIKDYVRSILVQLNLNPQITMQEFYQTSPSQIFLNFCVINMDRQKIEFLNKNNTPYMPMWAAVVAASSVPLFNRFFLVKHQWKRAKGDKLYHVIVRDFFKENYDQLKNETQYCSSNFLSRLPLELVTNKTLSKQIGECINYKEIAFAFNSTQNYVKDTRVNVNSGNTVSTLWTIKDIVSLVQKIRKQQENHYKKFLKYQVQHMPYNPNYIQKKLSQAANAVSWIGKAFKTTVTAILPKKRQEQEITSGDQSENQVQAFYSKIEESTQFKSDEKPQEELVSYYKSLYQKSFIDSSRIKKIFFTHVNSNDNCIMDWYSEKLVKLPIKFGTLDFAEVSNYIIFHKYGINTFSEKTKETIQRSYEITKAFAKHIFQEKKTKKASKQKNIQQGKEKLMADNKQKQQYQKKIEVKMRVSLKMRTQQKTKLKQNSFKIQFLNHSKWNQNGKSTYLVGLQVFDKLHPYHDQQKAYNSEFVFEASKSSKIRAKFYFPKIDKEQPYLSKIWYADKIINLSNVIEYFYTSRELKLYNEIDFLLQFDHNYELIKPLTDEKWTLSPNLLDLIEQPGKKPVKKPVNLQNRNNQKQESNKKKQQQDESKNQQQFQKCQNLQQFDKKVICVYFKDEYRKDSNDKRAQKSSEDRKPDVFEKFIVKIINDSVEFKKQYINLITAATEDVHKRLRSLKSNHEESAQKTQAKKMANYRQLFNRIIQDMKKELDVVEKIKQKINKIQYWGITDIKDLQQFQLSFQAQIKDWNKLASQREKEAKTQVIKQRFRSLKTLKVPLDKKDAKDAQDVNQLKLDGQYFIFPQIESDYKKAASTKFIRYIRKILRFLCYLDSTCIVYPVYKHQYMKMHHPPPQNKDKPQPQPFIEINSIEREQGKPLPYQNSSYIQSIAEEGKFYFIRSE